MVWQRVRLTSWKQIRSDKLTENYLSKMLSRVLLFTIGPTMLFFLSYFLLNDSSFEQILFFPAFRILGNGNNCWKTHVLYLGTTTHERTLKTFHVCEIDRYKVFATPNVLSLSLSHSLLHLNVHALTCDTHTAAAAAFLCPRSVHKKWIPRPSSPPFSLSRTHPHAHNSWPAPTPTHPLHICVFSTCPMRSAATYHQHHPLSLFLTHVTL